MKLMLCLSLAIFLSVQSGANPDVLEKLDSEIYGRIPIAEIDRYIPGDGKYCSKTKKFKSSNEQDESNYRNINFDHF